MTVISLMEKKMHKYTEYFKENKGFNRLIKEIYEKYRSLSKFSGTVKLKNLTKEESITLSRFFGVNYHEGETVTISLKKMICIMNNSRYDDFDFYTLIEEYFKLELMTKKEENVRYQEEEKNFYEEILKDIEGIGKVWLNEVLMTKQNPYLLIHKRYNKDKVLLKKELTNILNLVNNLPKTKILLPIYASSYTNDPHYLDLDNLHSTLFIYALSFVKKCSFPQSRVEKIKLLNYFNIEIDYLSNYVITYNLKTDKDYLNEFANNRETLILNMQNILNLKLVDSPKKHVYVFENPSILTEIIAKKLDASVIISGGFPNISVHLLIENLIQNGNIIFYNGDYDAEGLLIASQLKEKYGDNLKLICYSEVDYYHAISKVKISNQRLKKLELIENAELTEIKELLLYNQFAGYQENNKERILEFMKNGK